uniref:Uncharacterized protein n=1 Tax=Ananas comosus var. bracteatus TaxID=296719 RepID=A0A6V7NWK8_ANACO|nr:unnamed protein product [Ananas comosus var. bracteatus]
MPTTRSKSVGAKNAANLEKVETSATSGSSEVRDLRTQLAVLTDLVAQQATAAQRQADVVHRQEAWMKRLEDLLLQQSAERKAQVSPPPGPVEDVAPRAPSPAPGSSRAVFPVMVKERSGTGSWIASTSLGGAVPGSSMEKMPTTGSWKEVVDAHREAFLRHLREEEGQSLAHHTSP